VPAKVDGTWKLGQDELTLNQEFQKFYGTLKQNGKSIPVSEGSLNGTSLTFKAGGTTYTGQVNNNSMSGSFISGNKKADWSATKQK
jgi:hypothetical protein